MILMPPLPRMHYNSRDGSQAFEYAAKRQFGMVEMSDQLAVGNRLLRPHKMQIVPVDTQACKNSKRLGISDRRNGAPTGPVGHVNANRTASAPDHGFDDGKYAKLIILMREEK